MRKIKQSFNFILALALWLVATQMVWADDVTWYMNSGKGTTCNQSDHQAEFSSNGKTMLYTWTGTAELFYYGGTSEQTLFLNVLNNHLSVSFPYLEGTVTKVELYKLDFFDAGMKFSVGNGSQNLMNGNSEYCTSVDGSGNTQNVTFTGSVDVDADHPLRFSFSVNGSAPLYASSFSFWSGGYIKVTYTPAAAIDHGHSFNITTSGNVLTATCTNNEQSHQCITNHQATLTLVANDGMAHPFFKVSAAIDPTLGEFNNTTQLESTCTIEYTPQGSSNWTTTAPNTEGNYTSRATVRINDTDYELTSNFSVIAGYNITNNTPQQLSVNKTGAMAGDNITVTFTPKMDESLTTLTVTGDNTSLSIGNGITDNGDNTYTFNMPSEDVTLGATFNFPMDENNFAQDGDTYTIKNADGWNYFCQRMQYDANIDGFNGKTIELADDITVTKMAGTVHPFKGTFDGKGKTLTFNYIADAMYCAPFQNTNGATIRNLHVTGLIEGGLNSYIGGLVGSTEGNITISDCHVSTNISTTFDSNTLSANVGIGGIVGYIHYTTYGQKCKITGCVYDGLIYNPNYSGATYGCGGFVGCLSEYAYVDFTDCLFIEGQYDNNGGKHELLWGHDNNKNSTFFHRTNNQGSGELTNCFFVGTHGVKQGAPAVESAIAPANFDRFGTPTDHCFMKTYGRLMVFNNKYYTPPYGDLVEQYDNNGTKSYNIEYDDKPLGIPNITTQLWGPLLRYKRTFTNGKPVTVMLPFNFSKSAFKKSGSSDPLTGHFYEFKGISQDVDGTGKWVAVMKEVGDDANEVSTMKANTPYLYVPDDEPEYWYIYNGGDGVTIFTEGNDGGEKVTRYDGRAESFAWNRWDFIGTYQPRYWSETEHLDEIGKVYGFAGSTKEVQTYKPTIVEAGEFVRVASGAKIRPTSCYLKWVEPFEPEYDTAKALAVTRSGSAKEELPQCITVKLIDNNGVTTAIGELDTKTGEFSFDDWYTMGGVKLSGKPAKSGVYINNGKKIVIP